MVVPVDPTPVVLVVGAVVEVVVVEPLFGAVVDVVLVDVEVEVDAVVLVLVVVLVVVLVLVVVEVVVVGAGVGTKRFFNVGPEPAPPKIDDSGFPATSSTAVMNTRASRKTTPAVPASAFHVNWRFADGPGSCRVCSASGTIGSVSTSPDVDVDVEADGAVAWPGAGGSDSSVSAVPSLVPVAPSRRRKGLVGESDDRTTTWRTASCPRSID